MNYKLLLGNKLRFLFSKSLADMQNFYVYAFLVGNCLVWYGSTRDIWQVFWLIPLVPLLLYLKTTRLVAFVLLGILYAEYEVYEQLAWQFPESHLADNHLLTGQLEGLPEHRGEITRFRFKVNSINHQAIGSHGTIYFRLACYRACPNFRADQHWQLLVRLKPPNGYANPQGFDYEKWLYTREIKATGYIVPSNKNKLLKTTRDADSIREIIRDYIVKSVSENTIADSLELDTKGAILALALGDKSYLKDSQQQLLTSNGLSHLMAISGLHIGLSVMPGFILAGFFWRRVAYVQRFNRIAFQWGCCLVPAICYTALSGFGVPAIRSLLMIMVFAITQITRSSFSVHSRFGIALWLILLVEPLAPLQISFWLSFVATAILLLLSKLNTSGNALISLMRLQSQLFLLLMPVQLLIFGSLSLISPVINIVAIPFVSLILLPLILVLVALILISEMFITIPGIEYLLLLVEQLVHLFWQCLLFIKPLTQASQYFASQVSYLVLLIYPLVFLLLVAINMRIKLLLIFIFYLFQIPFNKSRATDFRMLVLDVGQGLSVTLEYDNKVLIYDTAYGSKDFNVTPMTLQPWLKSLNYPAIELMFISHNDADHSGGLGEILNSWQVDELVVGPDVQLVADSKFTPRLTNTCYQNQFWQWKDLSIRSLLPLKHEDTLLQGNDSSCVVLIQLNGLSILLTGDIETKAEQIFLRQYPNLTINILLVPHHGSKTSSTGPFVKQLKPDLGIISSGYLNRFNLPSEIVMKRYQVNGVEMFNTANSGAVEITLDSFGKPIIKQWRLDNRNLWRRH